MNIITADPGDHLNGYVTGQVGNYSLIQAEAAIGGPINDWLGVRIAGQTVDRGGYGHNIGSGEPVDDAHSRSVRGTLVAQFADNVKDRLVVDYYNARDHNYGYHILGGSFTAAEVSDPRLNAADYIPFAQKIGDRIPTNPQDYAGQNPQNHLLSYGLSNELSVDVSDLLTVTSVTGYRHVTATLLDNTYGGQKDLQPQSLYENSDSVTQELRLSGEKGILKYVIGGYYFNEDHVTDNRVPSSLVFFGGPENQWIQFYNAGGFETTNAYAAFGQVDMKILPKLTLSAGLRYSYEKKNIKEFQIIDFANAFDKNVTPLGPVIPTSGLAPQNHSWTSTDPRFTISYAFDPRVLAYATYSRGFKSGGFNLGGLQAPFNPERITDYEVGLKGDFLDGRLRANMSAFYYDYSNLQVNVVNQLVLQTLNAANAKIKGVEAEFTALPTPNLRLTLNGAWLDAYYTKFTTADPARAALGPLNLAGNRLNYAPKYKLAGSVAYTIHSPYGDFTPTADITWTDRLYFSPFNTSRISQPQHTNVDMSIRWVGKDPQWTGSIFVKNLTDKIYIIGAAIANPFVGSFRGAQVSAPRTFGAQLTRHF
jgi:iron complex outermembrane receptor protein